MKLPKGLKLSCSRHGKYLKYYNGEYVCTYGGYCDGVNIISKKRLVGEGKL